MKSILITIRIIGTLFVIGGVIIILTQLYQGYESVQHEKLITDTGGFKILLGIMYGIIIGVIGGGIISTIDINNLTKIKKFFKGELI